MRLAAVILTLSHLLEAWLPLVVALWSMVLVASHQEWGHQRQLVREATHSTPRLRIVLLVVEKHAAEIVCPQMWCQALVMRRYETC